MKADFDGQILEGDGTTVYGPWMQRKGDYLRGIAELIDTQSSGILEVQLFTKNLEDTGDGSDVDSGKKISITTANRRGTVEWGEVGSPGGIGLKELVRFKYKCRGTSASLVLFRLLSPVWFDAVRA